MNKPITHAGLTKLHDRSYLMPHLKDMQEHAEKYIAQGFVIVLAHSPIFSESGRVGCTCESYKRSDKYRQWLDEKKAEAEANGKDGKYLSEFDPNFVCPNPGKHPKGKWADDDAGLSLKQALHQWSRLHKETDVDTGKKVEFVWNMGILTGPSNVLTLDADTYKEHYACDLADVFLPDELDTPEQESQSGGLHYVFDRQGKPYTNSNGELKAAGIKGIDIRGAGGFQVLAPSVGFSGNEYAWIEGCEPWSKPLKPIPAGLDAMLAQSVGKAKGKASDVKFSDVTTEKPDLAQWNLSPTALDLLHNPKPKGERSEADFSLILSLIRAGASDDAIKAFFEHFPIGTQGRYAEKGPQYLALSIANARAYLANNPQHNSTVPGLGPTPSQVLLLSPGRKVVAFINDIDMVLTIKSVAHESNGVRYYETEEGHIVGDDEISLYQEPPPQDVAPALSIADLNSAIADTVQTVKADVLATDDKATANSIATATKEALTLWAIDNMASIAKLSSADVARLKVSLRGNGLTQTWLDRELPKLISAEKFAQRRAPQLGNDEPRYKVMNGHICYKYEKQIMQGEDVTTVTEYAPLCNFQAAIVADVVLDDGEEVTQHLAIAGELDSGEALPEIVIPSKEFEVMQWPVGYWGARAAVEPGKGKKDMLRHAIQTVSMDSVETRRSYTHTGWREINGKRVFLHQGGAIGMDGVTVSLPRQMHNYIFPDDNAVDYVTAMRESIRLMDVAINSISMPMWAITYAAVLTEIIPANFVVDMQGGTGSFKSAYSSVFLNHYGAGFTETAMPADWLGTANSLEKQTFHAKDVLTIIDDLKPTTNLKEANQQEEAVSRIARAVGNRQGRGRLDSNSDFKRSYAPRGAVAMNSEKKTRGRSANSRMMTINVEPGEISSAKLAVAQHQRHVYGYAMRGFIEYVAANWDELRKTLPGRVVDTRSLSDGNGQHKRLPNATAVLYTAFECAMSYAVEIGAIAEAEAVNKLDACYSVLSDMAEGQSEVTEAEDPALKYITIVSTLIAQNKAYLMGPVVDEQTKRRDNIGFASSEKLGWHDRRFVYLLPGAYNAVCRYANTEGWAFPSDEVTLRKELARSGYLEKTDNNRLTTKKREPGGKPVNVVAIEFGKLEEFLISMGVDTSEDAHKGVFLP